MPTLSMPSNPPSTGDVMVCPNCGQDDPFPPTQSDDGTTTCPKCGHRFPVSDGPTHQPAPTGVDGADLAGCCPRLSPRSSTTP